nr:NSP1 [Bat RVJ-like rotavirus BtSY2]
MLSKLRSFKNGKDLNDRYDFVSSKELWHGRFTTFPTDPIHVFENVDYSRKKIDFIQKTKSVATRRTAHVKMPVRREDMDYIDWNSQKMFIADCCSRKDDHYCGALHDIHTNDQEYVLSVYKRPQVQHRSTIFIPCGVKMLKLRIEGQDKLITASKTRRCMCGNEVITSAITTGEPGFQYIAFCSSDFLTVTLSGHRNKNCICCGKPTTAYEANPSTWKNATGDEVYPKGNLCCYCCPTRMIFRELIKNHYEPEVDATMYYERKQKWWCKEKFGEAPTFWHLKVSNHYDVYQKIVGFESFKEKDKKVTEKQNNSWIRDLAAEGVEENPGPNYTSSLFELAQKMRIQSPEYQFQEVKENENKSIFICTCTFLFKTVQGAGYTKKAAKNAASMNMLAVV